MNSSKTKSLNFKDFNIPQRKFAKTVTKSEETKVLSPKQMQEEFLKSFDSQFDGIKRIEKLKESLKVLDFKGKIDTKQSYYCQAAFIDPQIIVLATF